MPGRYQHLQCELVSGSYPGPLTKVARPRVRCGWSRDRCTPAQRPRKETQAAGQCLWVDFRRPRWLSRNRGPGVPGPEGCWTCLSASERDYRFVNCEPRFLPPVS